MVGKKNLTVEERQQMLVFLLERYNGTRLERGAMVKAAASFGVSGTTISCNWKSWVKMKDSTENGRWIVDNPKKIMDDYPYMTKRRQKK